MSEWLSHVKKVAKAKKISYKEAMSVAKSSYKPKGKKVPVKKEKKVPVKKEKKSPKMKKEKKEDNKENIY